MISYFMSNIAIMEYLGQQIRQMRLNARFTQEELAKRAGVSRGTVDNLEHGKGVKLESLIAILRALQKLEIFNTFETNAVISPILLAKAGGKNLQKVYKKRSK